MADEVRDNEAKNRFELSVDGRTAFAAYELRGDTITFVHTVVPPSVRGRGIATKLIAGALEQARSRGLRIVAQCPFVAAHIAREG